MTMLPPHRGGLALQADAGLPLQAGAGFKPQHLAQWLADPKAPAFAEVHAENYMGAGGAPHAQLERLRGHRPLSLHGVGLSIGGEEPLDLAHLGRLAQVIQRHQPCSFSEHLAWSSHGGVYYNDLLPLTYDGPTLDRVCTHIDQVQSHLRCRLLLENPSTYFEFEGSTLSEPQFLSEAVRRTGCGLLLDVNNVYVSCHNNSHDPHAYLYEIPLAAVGEIHLAGHARERSEDGGLLLIDDHGSPVTAAVWTLYAHVLSRTGPLPTLIEWDRDVPDYECLKQEVCSADALLPACVGTHEVAA